MPQQKHQTTINLPVELTFEILPEVDVGDYTIPPLIEITKVMLTIVGPSGKPRTIDVTHTFSESEILMMEDEVADHYLD